MKDFKRTADGDIDLSSGDIQYEESSDWHQFDILKMRKGEAKHAPGCGVGAEDYLNDENPEALMRETRRQFEKDGMKVREIRENEGKLSIDARYGS